jgi:hypothetical protein
MFDQATSSLLRSAPAVPGLNPDDIPALITLHYAALVSARLRGAPDAESPADGGWTRRSASAGSEFGKEELLMKPL